jgi:hypothetical protein
MRRPSRQLPESLTIRADGEDVGWFAGSARLEERELRQRVRWRRMLKRYDAHCPQEQGEGDETPDFQHIRHVAHWSPPQSAQGHNP